MSNIYLENEFLKIGVALQGGGLTSVVDKRADEELLWQGDSRSWTGQDVLIFPFVGRLRDKQYKVDGKDYSMEIHGLLRYNTLKLISINSDTAVLGFDYSEETLKKYPYKFRFMVTYRLEQNHLYISFDVENADDKTMYFGVGAHPGYIVDFTEENGVFETEGNFIEFDEPENLKFYRQDANGEFMDELVDFGRHKALEMTKAVMKKHKTLIFDQIKSSGITLVRKNGRRIRFEIGQPPILAFWSNESHGAYVCIEPWIGLPDFVDLKRELKDKDKIQVLEKGKKFNYSYKTTIL